MIAGHNTLSDELNAFFGACRHRGLYEVERNLLGLNEYPRFRAVKRGQQQGSKDAYAEHAGKGNQEVDPSPPNDGKVKFKTLLPFGETLGRMQRMLFDSHGRLRWWH